ncbi:hypothetical protein DFQ26_004387 [Actinomortierella ambigua]|nr:hypothetical protein DFQ26_004387 [Actinomortierella ambigua]
MLYQNNQMLELKLLVQYNMFSNGLGLGTYCHQVTDALISSQFPTQSPTLSVKEAIGNSQHSSCTNKRISFNSQHSSCANKLISLSQGNDVDMDSATS